MSEREADQANAAGRGAAAPGRRFVGSRTFKVALAALIVLAAYAIFGFLAAPRWIHAAATQAVERSLDLPLGLGEIRLNPFLFKVEIADFSLPDRAVAEPLVALDRLFVDFELSSIWHGSLVFAEIELDGPFARVIILPDKSLNLARLVPPPDPQASAEPEPDEAGLPALWIRQLEVADGHVDFADRSLRMTPEKEIAPIGFTLADFRTNPEGGTATLDARSKDGEGLAWEGRIALAPVASEGRFSVTALQARTVWEFLSEQLPLRLTDGSIDLEGSYELALDPEARVTLTLPEIELKQLALQALDADVPWITIPTVAMSDIAVSTAEQTLRVARVAIESPAIEAWLEPDGSLNLARLAGPAAASADVDAAHAPPQGVDSTPADTSEADLSATAAEPTAAIASEQAPQTAATSGNAASDTAADAPAAIAWTVELAEFSLNDAAIDFEDRTLTPPNPAKIAPLALNAGGVSLDLTRRIALSLAATINDRGQLTVDGDLAPSPLSADLKVAYDNGSLSVGQPYVSRVAALTVRTGQFDVDGNLALRPEGGAEPWLRFDGKFTAQQFNAVDNDQQQDLINFERLDVSGIAFALSPDELEIDEIVVTQPFARVIIAPDQTINIVEVFNVNGSPAQSDASDPAVVGAKSSTEPASEAFPVSIGSVQIKGGTLDFSDLFIEPNFAAEIDALNGRITAMSSDPASKAELEMKGHVISEFSPVSITGSMNLFSFDRHTDIDMEFRNIDLPVFNPYSGKFAGYAIAKGKLTTELGYVIQDRKLDAQHHIVLDQLEWGEKTDSEDAVTIPIKLATALLKDRNGVIDLEFPVGGSLDDPSFRIGPVIWQVIRNLLVKIVTAPFAFIGSLFEGAEDAQFVSFAPGSAELTVENANSLAALANALLERPQLRLDVPVRRMPEVDGPALVSLKYQRELETATRIATGTAADAPVDFDALEPEQKLAVLTAVYTVLAGSAPSIPEAPPPPEGTSRADARILAIEHSIAYVDETNRTLIEITDDDLLELAEARAQAVQRALLAGAAIDPERVFLTAGERVTVDGDQVKLELGLE